MSCLQRNVSLAGSPWRRATGGWRRSTITTTVSASTARCARKTSKDRVSSPKEADPFVRYTPARSPQNIIYNSDTVYSTTTFRPVSVSPRASPALTTNPQRTRKLETPLHFDGGLFSDIRSTDGKLLSKVTVDRVHSSTRRDITDSPSVSETLGSYGNKKFVDDIVKTETITNEDVFKVKFTPVPPELDTPRLLTPSQFQSSASNAPVEYIKDKFEDLQSYKIVSSLCKEKRFEPGSVDATEKKLENLKVCDKRASSPLANIQISEQLTKINNYLQESLDVCAESQIKSLSTPSLLKSEETRMEISKSQMNELYQEKTSYSESSTNSAVCSYHDKETNSSQTEPTCKTSLVENTKPSSISSVTEIKSNGVKDKQSGVLSTIYNMPIHYHAAIMCFLLIVYNLIYQYLKQNCYGNRN